MQYIDPPPTLMAISVVSFSFSRADQPEAQGLGFLLSAGFLYHILSPTGLVSKLTDFLSSPSYIIVPSPTQSLEWHVLSSSSGNNCNAVHRSLSSGASVYDCTAGFFLVLYYQPSPPMRFLPITAIGMCHFRRLWNDMFGRVEGQYTTDVAYCFEQIPEAAPQKIAAVQSLISQTIQIRQAKHDAHC